MRNVNLNILVAFYMFMTALMGPVSEGKLIIVDDDAPANFISIQPAINYASNGDLIEVRPGTYYEAINFGGKTIRLYSSGGPEVTIIDANGAYHVVQCVNSEDANTILEGFTITGGNANGTDPNDASGGGMYNNGSSPMVTNCTFSGNETYWGRGGGMYNYSSSPTVTNCTFSDNTTVLGDGGGMYNYNSSPTVTNCTFSGNETSIGAGGGMYNYNSSPTVTNCTFTANWTHYGGGIYSAANVTNCTFRGNYAYRYGGGINGADNVTNCTFISNGAEDGGGIYSAANVTNCTFRDNSAYFGGGICSADNVTNCTFSGNTAEEPGFDLGWGGGINGAANVTNCTFRGNYAYLHGGGINGADNVTNCILWGNIAPTGPQIFGGTVTYCDVQGGWPDANNTNIDADPRFVDPNNPDKNLRNLRLKPDSPCIDAGNSTVVLAMSVAYDLDSKDRYIDIDNIDDTGSGLFEFVDMGAYEFKCDYTPGDSNCDGVVDFKDLAILCGNWLAGTELEL